MEFHRNLVAALAIASVVLAKPAAADDANTIVITEVAPVSTETVSRDRAAEANEDAAEKAVKAVLIDTKLDLDIRLIGPTSVKIADAR